MRAVRVGVVGVGGMGAFHARTLAALAGVDVVAVADPDASASRELADDLGAAALTDPMALASADDLDGIVIASPDRFHAEQTLAAITRGTRVLCEKPLSTSLDDAWRVVQAEVDRGSRLVQVGFMREYDPAHTQLVERLDEIGELHTLRCLHRNANDFDRPAELIVGQSLVHDIHTVRFLSGAEVETVDAVATDKPSGALRCVTAMCTLDSGAHAVLEFDDSAYAYEVVVELTGAHASACSGGPTRAMVRRDGTTHVDIGTDWFAWFAEAYRIQDQAWVTSLREGMVVGPSAWDGLVAQVVVDAAMASLASGGRCPVVIPERPPLYG